MLNNILVLGIDGDLLVKTHCHPTFFFVFDSSLISRQTQIISIDDYDGYVITGE